MAVLLVAALAIAQDSNSAPPSSPKAAGSPAFSGEIAEGVLRNFRDALVGHDRDLIGKVCDRDRMPDYSGFRDQIYQLFQRYDRLRVSYHVKQTVDEAASCIAIVDFTLETTPFDDTQLPIRRTGQLRFSFARGSKDWKIVDIQPRSFFNQF